VLRAFYNQLSPHARAKVKKILSSVGHRASFLDPLRARHQALTKKSFSSVATYLSEHLRLAGITDLNGRRCLEFGCGHVPTELAYYDHLGAARIIGLDYNRIAKFNYMRIALRGSPAERFDPAKIEYIAPFDALRDSVPPADFIHSEAVLEHVPPDDALPILRNLAAALPSGGVMINNIDLRDHKFWHEDPNAFLLPASDYRESDYDARGNRLRKSDWTRIFEAVEGIDSSYYSEVVQPAYKVPGYSDEDLATLRLVVVSRKR